MIAIPYPKSSQKMLVLDHKIVIFLVVYYALHNPNEALF